MAEHLEKAEGGKEEKYSLLLRQIEAMAEMEDDCVALLANAASMIHFTFDFFWTGFYLVKKDVLVLGPFQGPLACTRIRFGKGVCGTAWERAETIVVVDVDKFPGHIACSSESRSEIVTPILKDGVVTGVLDIDSKNLAEFDSVDAFWTQKICAVLSSKIK